MPTLTELAAMIIIGRFVVKLLIPYSLSRGGRIDKILELLKDEESSKRTILKDEESSKRTILKYKIKILKEKNLFNEKLLDLYNCLEVLNFDSGGFKEWMKN